MDIPSDLAEAQQFLGDLLQRVAALHDEGEADPWPDAVLATLNDPNRKQLGVGALHILTDQLVRVGSLLKGAAIRNLSSRGFTASTVNAIIALTLQWQPLGIGGLVFEPNLDEETVATQIRGQLEGQLFPLISTVVELEDVSAQIDESVLLVEIRYRLRERGEQHTCVLTTDLGT